MCTLFIHLPLCSPFFHFSLFVLPCLSLFTSSVAAGASLLSSLSDSSLSLAGSASLSGGSASGLLLPETGPPGQPPTTLALGRPLPVLLPQVERGFEEKVHFPAARTPEDHPGGRGATMRLSSTSCSTSAYTDPVPQKPPAPPNLGTPSRGA